jgi:para-nitrobenzyl esterase
MPGFSGNPQIDMARSMTLKQIQQFAGDQITDDVLAKVDADLAKIPAAK